MEYRILGSIEVRSDGEIVGLGPPKQRATLAILLLRARQARRLGGLRSFSGRQISY